jgi:SAM-dependent methyltransferase
MHEMDNMLRRVSWKKARVLDVGSYDVNGTYKPLIEKREGWEYVGLDVAEGPNVDVVAKDPYKFPFKEGEFDVVISGSTMEHVQATWKWVPELARVLRPGGLLCIVTHWSFPEHRYPVDCWRILPDGMTFLFDETHKLENYDVKIVSLTDIAGSAFKVEPVVEKKAS